MKRNIKLFSLLTMLMFVLTACAPKVGGSDVNASEARRYQSVSYGYVTAIHHVKINNDGSVGSTLGVLGGAIVGGIIGNLFGAGAGNTLATLGGAAAGGAAGYGVSQQVENQAGYQIEVELENGRRVSVVQGTDYRFNLGQNVSIVDDGKTVRVLPRN